MIKINSFSKGSNAKYTVSGKLSGVFRSSYDAILSRIVGLPGGATNMEVFSAHNHAAGTYTRNANLWCADLLPQLSGCVIAKRAGFDGWNDQYGGVAITPRHVLYTGHAHPQAAGTWPPDPGSTPTIVRFMKADGTIVERTQIHQGTSYYSNAYTPQSCTGIMGPADCSIGVLDSDLPVGINILPLFPEIPLDIFQAGDPYGTRQLATFALSQGYHLAPSAPPTPISDYPQHNNQMFHIVKSAENFIVPPPFDLFDYMIWPGDSGTPHFLIKNGTVCVYAIISGVSCYYPGTHSLINCLIAAANQNAVNMGRMTPGEADYQLTSLNL